jgi:hypothetical protein
MDVPNRLLGWRPNRELTAPRTGHASAPWNGRIGREVAFVSSCVTDVVSRC